MPTGDISEERNFRGILNGESSSLLSHSPPTPAVYKPFTHLVVKREQRPTCYRRRVIFILHSTFSFFSSIF